MRYKIFSGGLLLLVVGFLLGWSFHPTPANGPTVRVAPAVVPSSAANVATLPAQQTASVMLDFGDGTVRTFPRVEIAGAKTVFDVIKTLSQRGDGFAFQYQPPGKYGILIDQIGNKKGGAEGKYWLFWVNNAMAEQSADNTPIHPGDAIEWKFINLKMDGAAQP